MAPLKTVQILYSGLGGHGSVAFSLLEASDSKQWTPALGFLGIEPLVPAYAEMAQAKSASFEYFKAVSGQPWRSWPAIYRWLSRQRAEAVILHSVSAVLPCWLVSKRTGARLIAVEHQQNALKRDSEWLVSHSVMRLADAVVCLTPQYVTELEAKLGSSFKAEKVTVIPNGIDTNLFCPGIREKDVDRPVIRLGMAARFVETKRQELLVETLEALTAAHPKLQFELSLAGDGETMERVRRVAATGSVASAVALPGYLDEPALIDWLHSIDIYLHASDGETLSTAILQAMSCQLPIVASKVQGISNLLEQEGRAYGLLADNTMEGFAAAISELAHNSELAKELAAKARSLAIEKYSNAAMFDAYNVLLGKPANP